MSFLLFVLPCQAVAQGLDDSVFLASMCVTCHGYGGQGSKRIPQLTGLKAQDLIESMNGFRSGEANSTVMGIHARGYTEEEIRLIAQYFSALDDE